MRTSNFIVFGFSILLCACAASQLELEMNRLTRQCDLTNDPRFQILQGKIVLSIEEAANPPSLAEIMNEARPTEQEREALFLLDQAYRPCTVRILQLSSQYDPPIVTSALKELASASILMYARLVDGQITYGEYRQQSYEMGSRTDRVIAEYLQVQQIADAARKQAAAAQLMATMQTIQTLSQSYLQHLPPSPIITNCNRLGGAINCVTY